MPCQIHYESVLFFCCVRPRIYSLAFIGWVETTKWNKKRISRHVVSCHWQVVREQIKTFVSVKQLFASVEGQPKLVNLG